MFLRIGEYVFNNDPHEEDNRDVGMVLLIDGKNEGAYIDEDSIVTLAMKHNDYKGENETYGCYIQKIF